MKENQWKWRTILGSKAGGGGALEERVPRPHNGAFTISTLKWSNLVHIEGDILNFHMTEQQRLYTVNDPAQSWKADERGRGGIIIEVEWLTEVFMIIL